MPRLIADLLRLPWYLHTFKPKALGFRQRSFRALHLAVQRWVLPEVMFGRGIDGFSYTTSAEVRAGRTAAELFADLTEGAPATIATCFHFHAPHIAYLPFSLFS